MEIIKIGKNSLSILQVKVLGFYSFSPPNVVCNATQPSNTPGFGQSNMLQTTNLFIAVLIIGISLICLWAITTIDV